MQSSGNVIPFSFDLSSLVQRSVASLYSHLVTRPTGRALRLGIESQIGEIGSVCLSVLDFTQVVVLDYSCADEAVAKLIQRYQLADRPADAYFVARGLGEQHRDPINEVLIRHGLSLVAEVEGEFTLLGRADTNEHEAWHALQRVRLGDADEVAVELDAAPAGVTAALERLAARRVVIRRGAGDSFCALTTLLPPP
jgi:sugar/nucleoside kinase (ribokinase family)